jgi:hypothetical protein
MERVDSWTSEPSKLDYEKPCGSRLADRCPHCSEVYRRDAFAVLRAGLQDAANSTTPFTFITFTTPGADVFGATHQRVTATSKKNKTHVRPYLIDARRVQIETVQSRKLTRLGCSINRFISALPAVPPSASTNVVERKIASRLGTNFQFASRSSYS